MQIRSISPSGIVTIFNLDRLPAWRLELGSMTPPAMLGIGVKYITGDKPHWGWICALNCISEGNEVQSITAKGLARKDPDKNKELLQESMKILFNADGLKPVQVDELIQKSAGLVDVYHQVLQAVRTGAEARGTYE